MQILNANLKPTRQKDDAGVFGLLHFVSVAQHCWRWFKTNLFGGFNLIALTEQHKNEINVNAKRKENIF